MDDRNEREYALLPTVGRRWPPVPRHGAVPRGLGVFLLKWALFCHCLHQRQVHFWVFSAERPFDVKWQRFQGQRRAAEGVGDADPSVRDAARCAAAEAELYGLRALPCVAPARLRRRNVRRWVLLPGTIPGRAALPEGWGLLPEPHSWDGRL